MLKRCKPSDAPSDVICSGSREWHDSHVGTSDRDEDVADRVIIMADDST
jgi:hypothetical protein